MERLGRICDRVRRNPYSAVFDFQDDRPVLPEKPRPYFVLRIFAGVVDLFLDAIFLQLIIFIFILR
jgi:hypothetical protein